MADTTTGVVAFVPEYATSCTVPCTTAGNVTVTDEPGSPAVATFDHAAVVTAVPPDEVPSGVQPAGALERATGRPVAMSTSALPAATVFGTVSVSVVALPLVLAWADERHCRRALRDAHGDGLGAGVLCCRSP